ncbi:MAG: hypothetical protein NXI07_14250, partial [bacterium]|nr:hypothetical protein [bacterium]
MFLKTTDDGDPDGDDKVTCVTGVEVDTSFPFCSVALSKGGQDLYVIRAIRAWMDECGLNGGCILQGDPESSIMDVLRKVAGGRASVRVRQTPVASHQSNGSVERMHRSIQGMARTLRLMLQDSYKIKIRATDTITSWIVRHAAFLIGRFQVHTDGMTSYQRLHKVPYKEKLVDFGEIVIYREHGEHVRKLETKWEFGVWLGRTALSTEHLIGTTFGIIRARRIRRRETSELRWDLDVYEQMRGFP